MQSPSARARTRLQHEATRLRERSVAGCLGIVLVANGVVFWALADSAADGRLSLARAIVFLQAAIGVSALAFGGLNWALDGAAAPVAAVMRLEPAMAPAGALVEGLRDEPLVLLLDEPTAALDAETEHALFQRYAETSRARAERGGITVLVSHRFSTVRMADLIVVMDGARVAEVGSHEELMARGRQYSELYAIQAASFR